MYKCNFLPKLGTSKDLCPNILKLTANEKSVDLSILRRCHPMKGSEMVDFMFL